MTASAIYAGHVRHRRMKPATNEFRYSIFMMFVDLVELPALFKGRWFWSVEKLNLACFLRRDYFGDKTKPLDVAIRDLVENKIGRRPSGPIRLLTYFRHFGFIFNPVSFYYCYQNDGTTLDTIVAEITNTPWKERHQYVLPVAAGQAMQFNFDKEFHVSPFMPMKLRYAWNFNLPGKNLTVHMENTDAAGNFFDATLTLEKQPLTGQNLALVLWRYPFMTLSTVFLIHYQALKLWIKKVPVFTHPNKLDRHIGESEK